MSSDNLGGFGGGLGWFGIVRGGLKYVVQNNLGCFGVFGVVWSGLGWLGVVWNSLGWSVVCISLDFFGMVWRGLGWLVAVWKSLRWFGVLWVSVGWFGLICEQLGMVKNGLG